MTWLMQSKHLAVVAACFCLTTLAAGPATAQQPNSATIDGTFIMAPLAGNIGPDLAEIVARDETHTWTLTLHGLSYSHDYEVLNSDPNDFYARSITRVYATGFDFQFQGPDADALNSIVSDRLVNGGLQDGPFVELRNNTFLDQDWDWLVEASEWVIRITPIDYEQGFRFSSIPSILGAPYAVDANGYPVLEPFTCQSAWALITDSRSGYAGSIGTQGGNIVSVSLPLPGDYNHDGAVDAADYVVWRKTGINGPTGYDTWRTNFGEPAGSGSVASANATVPEPKTLMILSVAVVGIGMRRRQIA